MSSILALALDDDARPLPRGTSVEDMADACRRALLSFLELSQDGADRTDLASWLVGPYRDTGARPSRRTHPGVQEPRPAIDHEQLASVVADAADRAMRVLGAFRLMPDASIDEWMVGAGVVERVVDDNGTVGYAPCSSPSMRLRQRILALVVAEILTRPDILLEAISEADGALKLAEPSPRSQVIRCARHTIPYRPEMSSQAAWPIRIGR